MTTVRLSQFPPDDQGRFPIEIELDHGGQRRRARAVTGATLTDADRQDLHWYLEEYLEQTYDPHPQRAARIEARMEDLGDQLFRDLFQAGEDAADLWATLRHLLPEARFEIASGVQEGTAIPWELLRDPRVGRALALGAAAFVRTQSNNAVHPKLPELGNDEKLRILLVICRPGLGDDVPFRSVASRLLKAVTEAGRARIDLTVLRPPSFEQLSRVLREAKKAGTPFHIVHFDGHGAYLDRSADKPAGGGGAYNPRWLGPARKGKHGYLAFENQDDPDNETLVGGPELGALLREAAVPVLVLNACRSAHADGADDKGATPAEHQQLIRAFGSLAQEVVDAGVGGVLAMRYNVYVVTAAQYVGKLYTHLAAGAGLGEAATEARRHLADKPARGIAGNSVDLQDWVVPVLYEANPIRLLPQVKGMAAPLFDGGGRASGDTSELPPTPDIGFIGRDETLLALDRAFDRHRVVLLHGFAGTGKTSTAAEFARWYRDTGGLGDDSGIILFDSFEQVQTLPRLLDKLGGAFGEALEAQGIRWLALSEDKRRDIALDILRQAPVLWIWDNVEPVAGFPAGTPSQWSDAEQTELRAFLAAVAAGNGRGRILLTSRRDERGWLGNVPARFEPPPMPMRERLAMAEELARRHGHGAGFSWILLPLLEYSQGNPMTLTVLVGQALRDKRITTNQIEEYVDALRRGEAAFDDDLSQGRTRSLGASLDYGFKNAFSEEERKRLALLHLLQGFVDVDVLVGMGVDPGCLEAIRGLDRAAWLPLLDRAAEIGLLTALKKGSYRIHPALPWFLKSLFDTAWPTGATADVSPQHAYALAVANLGSIYHAMLNTGRHEVLGALQAEEANLLHALRLSHRYRWPSPAIGTLQGLRGLYTTSGRWAAWAQLVTEAKRLVCDSATNGPLVGLEEEWSLWMEYEADLARQGRDHERRLRLLRDAVDWKRRRAAAVLDKPPTALNDKHRNIIRSLSVSLQRLGTVLIERNDAEAVEWLTESLNLDRRIGDRPGEAVTAFNLGHAYLYISAVRDLDEAEHWYRTSLSLRFRGDAGAARCYGQLGSVALQRFDALREQLSGDNTELLRHLQDAEAAFKKALATTPDSSPADLAIGYTMLGTVYERAGLLEPAAENYRLSIQYEDKAGNRFGAGQSRFNLGIIYLQQNRLPEARDYALAALDDFRSFGTNAAEEIAKTEQLLADIDAAAAPG